ncbi:Mitochondrial chaperone [Pyrenophora seminiperda CCB06]|uniref:Mitochondrial chaperone n=1 Tax=Pyrenophora seminiperda CCB06 TaxID=1302712 RepID=A0A3M7M5K5_9PLEO|nr:Mitochondrial chaperone [Pyrenophora seminiperda CCB06]
MPRRKYHEEFLLPDTDYLDLQDSREKPKVAPKAPKAQEEQTPKQLLPAKPPGTFQSWLFGVMNGGQDSWLMRYMESEFYELARRAIQTRTGADIHMVLMGCAALNAARVKIPAMLGTVLNQVKTQVTSSIQISTLDPMYKDLLQLAREKSEENQSSFRLTGDHQLRKPSGEIVPLSANFSNAFWHNGTHFTLESQASPDAKAEDASLHRSVDPLGKLTIRCFGHSRNPILKLFKHVQERISQSSELQVYELGANRFKNYMNRRKRPLATVDLDPRMMQDIIQDVELFFHKDSQMWYENTGRPWRHGYLLRGPPGTGKSSLIAAIASHINVPLYLINLQGMDDADLKEAFDSVPTRSCIALEDIDCVGADVGNRAVTAIPGPSTVPANSTHGSGKQPESIAMAMESMLATFMERQEVANQRVLRQVDGIKDLLDDQPMHRITSNQPSNENGKSLTLSGLLNVLDGVSASEGRLVIMTTNHPEKLDPALYRAGRVERKFEVTYASKASSIMTFKRLFGNDCCKKYTPEAIDCFAEAFQDQFPSKSRITTAELAKYCGQYRGRPDIAVKEFADWTKRGADKFTIPVNYTKVTDEEGVNVPEPFDSSLLLVSASDLVDPNTAAVSGIQVVTSEVEATASASWNPFRVMANVLLNCGEYTDVESIQDSLVHADSEVGGSEVVDPVPVNSQDLVLAQQSFSGYFDDDDFDDDDEPLALVSPRPMSDDQ